MYDQFGFAAFDQGAGAYSQQAVEIRTAVRMETRSAEAETTAAITNFTLKETRTICSAISLIRCFMAKAVDSEASGIRVREAADIRLRMHFPAAVWQRISICTLRFRSAWKKRHRAVKNRLPCGTRMERPIRCWLKIPAGIESGKSIRLRGKGHTGSNGRRGDLLLKVNVEEKKGFERRGMDIYTTIQIPYTTAVFGGEARVSTLYGDVVCKIKEGTQSGSKLRLRGKGMVSMKDANVHG